MRQEAQADERTIDRWGGQDEGSRLVEAVVYQIYPRSFADANADEIGDHLTGITKDTISARASCVLLASMA